MSKQKTYVQSQMFIAAFLVVKTKKKKGRDWWMKKPSVAYPYTGILSGNEKESTDHGTTWMNTLSERSQSAKSHIILYDSAYMKGLEWTNSETESGLVVVRVWEKGKMGYDC